MTYKSYEDLSDCIRRNAWKIPQDVDLIVGVPRSGMIPALMLAELLNGKTDMRKVRERMAPLEGQYDIIYGCVYAEGRNAKRMVNIWLEDIWREGEKMWLYEWNVLHHYGKKTQLSMWDIDGLVCKEPPDDRNTPAYEAYLPDAVPMIIPTTRIGAFVTYRLEKYRGVTEAWLHGHGIDYGELLMFDAPNRDIRNNMMSPAKYKAQLYRQATWAQLFMESDARQAERIFQLAGKPVWCYENGRVYQ